MAVQLILQRAGGGTINLYNKNAAALSTVTRAEQKQFLLGEDIVNVTVESAVKIPFAIGDKTTIFGRDYKINRLPKPKKTGNRLFTYDIELEGVQYDLMRATYDLNIDTTNNELQDVQADTLTGNLHRFATVLIANANRVFPGKWTLGEYPADTEDKTLTFGETDNCLSVLQQLCSEYNTEFDIEQAGGVNTINFGKAGQIFPYTFEYGKGKGLYELERQNVSSANIVTRLKVLGGTRNVSYKYRANRLCLPGKTKGQSYIEKPDAVNKYGIWEATKYFDNIYPSRTGTITGLVSGSVLKFVDNTMNFDLNEKEADGVTTKYLLDGVAAKIHFNSGNLSGYEFELQSYDHATKTFTLKPFKDERDETFPSEKSEAFQFAAGDKYVILDIALPQTYIDDAEVRLAAEGNTYYDQNSQPKVQYSLAVAEEFLKSLSGVGGTTNIFQVGDYLPVKDTDIDVDKSVRIQGFTRNLIDEYKYQLTISDTVTTNITNRVISELIDIDKVIKINNLKDPAKARRDWRSAQELLDMIFDTEGDYYSEKIKPGSIETQMLSVGAKSTQFGLVGTVIQANYNGNKNSVRVTGGVLTHYTITDDGRIWNLADNTTTLTGDGTPYYMYAKCQRVGTAGSVIFSTEQIKVEQDPDFYHFFVGVVNSVDPTLNVRSVALTYGFTTINGRFVRTGRIQSNDGSTYFDLDLGEIGGKITFASGGSQTDLSDWANDIIGDIQDTQQAASDADAKAQQALDEAANIVTDFNAEIATLQQQIDGEVSNWFYPYSPTLANYPASDWTTNEIKDRHIGDTFTNTAQAPATDAGKSWRFVKNGSVYSWTLIADSDAVKALLKAAEAQATADGKSTTFLVQPSKYHLGDTWVLNADRTINGTAYKQGEILTATQDSTTFNEAHWLKRVRYTDDTAVDNLQIGGVNLLPKSRGTELGDYANGGLYALGGYGISIYGGDSFRIASSGVPDPPDNQNNIRIATGKTLQLNETYTLSFEARTSSDQDRDHNVRLPYLANNIVSIKTGENFQKYSVTFKITNENTVNGSNNYFFFWQQNQGIYVTYLRKIKLEKGTKATDWSPAPEDVQAAIDAAVVKATYWSVKASAPVIYKDAINAATSGTHTPVTVSGELRSGTTTTAGGFITVTPNGGTEAGTASASPVTIAPANGDGKTSYTVKLYDTASKTTLLDTQTIPVVFKGASGVNAISAVLSNEADVLPASSEGVVSDYSGSGTEIRVFEGATELSYGTGNGQYQVSASGSGITVGTPSTSGNRRVYGVASNMTSDNATITFTITGKTASGTSFSLTKVQAFAKSRTGQKGDTGASAPLLYLSASAQVMKCNPDNTPQTGQTISIEAKLQNVSGTATFVATPYNDAGTALTAITLGGTGNTRTLTNAQWLATYKRIEVVATLGSLNDKVTIYRVADGATGKGISGTEIKYQVGASGTTAPTGTWLTSVPTVPEGQFLWTRTVTSYTDSTSTTSYSVSKQGVSGSDGKGIISTVITYQASSSGTVVPTGTWSGTIPSVSENQYLWTRTVITYTDSSTSTSYSVGKMGAKGDAGQNAIVGLLTNESVTLQANSAGVVSSFTPANGEFWVYNGATKVTSGITFSKVSETGCTAAITSAGVYSVSAMSADNAKVVLRAVYGGVTIDKVLTLSKSRAGADGVSITLVDVEFAKNTNPTTAPTTGWTTTAPTLAEGEQLWTRTKTSYSSGNPTYSTPANITPKKGDTGAVGQGVESVTEEFAISSSKTVQPTSGWSTTQPTWVQGQYIWSRVKVVYKNPAQTIYTGYAVSSEWEAVNELQIGGVNLLPKSRGTELGDYANGGLYALGGYGISIYEGDSFRIASSGVTDPPDNQNNIRIATGKTLQLNETYTLSFEARTSSDQDRDHNVRLPYLANNIVSIKTGENFQKYSVTFKITNENTVNGSNNYFFFWQQNQGIYATYLRKIKLEKGNKATDWSPAPEDVEAEIDAANAIAADALAKANTSKAITDKFGTTIDGGLISTVITEFREADSEQVTGLISGIQGANKDLPFLVAGGTYAEGIAGTAKAIIRHDGTSKFTDAEVEGEVTAKEGKIGDMSIINGALTSNYSYFTYIGAVYVQVTVIMNLSQSGLTLTSSYGGTTDHPQVVTWTCEIGHTSIKVGSMEMRRDGIYRDGTKIL